MRRSLAFCVAVLAAPVAADDGLIAPSDLLALRVTEWRPIDGELREWEAIGGSFPVGADGVATFPYVGDLPVAGQSPVAVGAAIGAALKQRFALADEPHASVVIETRSPVLVGGAVERPGEVPFKPGMTARHALALAGGVTSPGGDAQSALSQGLNAEAQVRILTDQEAAGIIRIARLRAELDGAVTLPPDSLPLAMSPVAATLVADANRFLALQADSIVAERRRIDNRITLIEQEIAALTAKAEALGRQKTLADEQRAVTEDLADRGLAANARLLDAERSLVTIETQVLDVSTALLEARQELEDALADGDQLAEKRAAEIMTELQVAELELAETRERLTLQRSLAELSASLMSGETLAEAVPLAVTVYRGADPEPVGAGLDTVLRPGDLVEVTLRPVLPQQGG